MTAALTAIAFRYGEQDNVRVPKLNALTSYVQSASEITDDPTIIAFAGLTGTVDTVPYFTGDDTMALTGFTATARSLLDDTSTSAMRTTLGLAIGTNVQAYDADLTTWAGITPGTGVGTALAINVGSAGAFVTSNGALGTPSSGTLTNATGLPAAGLVASTTQAVGFGSIELGHATDTTIARVSAGKISVEGVNVVTVSSTDTLTNKTLTSPSLTGTILADAAGAANLKTTQNSGSIADNGTYDFPSQGYGLFMIVEAGATGAWAFCGTDGGTVKIISQSAALFTPTINTASSVNLYYNAGTVRVQNKRGGASNFRIFNIQLT